MNLENYIGHLIRRAEQVHTAMWAAQVSQEITSQQFAVLNALRQQSGIDQRTLASVTSLDRSTVNLIVRRLTDQQYVTQVRDAADRRRTLLSLTDNGDRLLGSLIPPAQRVNEQLLSALPASERASAVSVLRTIADMEVTSPMGS
ncbi:MarR family winged helix-turn-helix transcriptional regulator (plasmid) [Streptomyces sp. NBC_01591]|uniref:MarR family winged helix-turn-helix transcriptional regulator n=1 Tax=Streptomyces sp. NBC_01591 TaxID=2975888 RepID=UPI002DDC49C2|nr:MarR family winged helix-turn-helix transcriptional regulator [Streptomyces sp. NBC_01591]WSD74078.1 MarR family winged helix-turn-helix transcriptional regulator [Streptomyces sp. NBC_01591]